MLEVFRRGTEDAVSTPKPVALRVSYFCALISAVALLVSGLALFSVSTVPSTDNEIALLASRNIKFIAVVNILGGLIVAALAAQFGSAGKMNRRVYTGVAVVLIASNLLAIMLRIGGYGLMVIVVALSVSVMAYFRTTATQYISRTSR